ncbi:MAG: hypothetical protein R3F49_19540 [Planctomycetota bacterium]
MASPKRELADALRRDLLEVCAHLLDRYTYGGSEGPRLVRRRSPVAAQDAEPLGPLGLILRGAAALTRHLPLALAELVADPIGGIEVARHQSVPRRALPSRSPADYASTAGTALASVAALMPRSWIAWAPSGRPPRAALAWVVSIVEGYRAALAEHVAGLGEALEEAIAFRGARSAYGLEDVQRIEGFERRLRRADASLAAMRARLVALGGHGLVASRRLPDPFPRGASWAVLRGLASGLVDPRASAAVIARELADRAEVGLDLAYLYQRWCGWRLVEGLEALGWRPRTDPLPALLMAGAIEFERAGGGDVLELLCEPRLASRKPPVHGVTAAVGELTPDFVLLTHRGGVVDAHVLDPTLSLDAAHRRSKRKYLRYIQLDGVRVVSGVRVVAGPLRSWACAPLQGTRCVLDSEDWRGAHGTVPMNPVDYRPEALLDWLRDLG